jgi:hypothetical protein
MPSLKIERLTGEVEVLEITPVAEVSFESYFGGNLAKMYADDEKKTYLFWMAHTLLKNAGKWDVPVWGDDFLKSLRKVSVVPDAESESVKK